MALLLARDEIWSMHCICLQVEFIVDNKTVGSIANGISKITNPHYQAPLDRIRGRLLQLFRDTFEYKACFLDPVDWRPREFNTAADHVANCVLADKADIDTLGNQACQSISSEVVGLQIFCDGGWASGCRAAAFVVTCVQPLKDCENQNRAHDQLCDLERVKVRTDILGARGLFIIDCKSAFHAETTALDIATEWLASSVPALA